MNERLTKYSLGARRNDGSKVIELTVKTSIPDALEKLAHFEDLEEQGRLIELPCKVGDIVYYLGYKPCRNGNTLSDSMSCGGCYGDCDLTRDVIERRFYTTSAIVDSMLNFGTYYFFTRAEAEAALKERVSKDEL